MATPAPHLVDEILEEIFLRLPTPAALARASTASPRFRRIITERSFLRRFRKRHPPPLLGFADEEGFHPAQAPHPSSALARAFAAAADFTYSFVPKPSKGGWMPSDIRDGRVLLEEDNPGLKIFRNLAVCDPLSRRHRLLP
uniref:Uncharacterized protein n=1 Tax=Avena sativa TaxID=4498 RepID=A0ACD5TCD8_AVESA